MSVSSLARSNGNEIGERSYLNAIKEPFQKVAEKIQQFLATAVGKGTLFSLLAGVAVAAMGGVQWGLLAAGVGGIGTWVLTSCCAERGNSAPPVASSAEQVQVPVNGVAPAAHPAVEEPLLIPVARNLRTERRGPLPILDTIDRLTQQIRETILQKSLHFRGELLWEVTNFLLEGFPGMNYDRVTLSSVETVRFDHFGTQYEGYKITLQSQEPVGKVRFYVNKDFNPHRLFEQVTNATPIQQVTPFLGQIEEEQNHWEIEHFPVRDALGFVTAFAVSHPGIDQTQIRLVSHRPVSYTHTFRPLPNTPHFIASRARHQGYELNLQTPDGGMLRYFVDVEGEAAPPEEVQDVAPRQGIEAQLEIVGDEDALLTYWNTIDLPFGHREYLVNTIREDYPEMDQTEMRVISCEPCSYTVPVENLVALASGEREERINGYRLSLQLPDQTRATYYASDAGVYRQVESPVPRIEA